MVINVSIAQFAITIGEPEKNLTTGLRMIEQAAAEGSSLIQLPELWVSGYDLDKCEAHSQKSLEIIDLLQGLADKHNLAIGGSYITTRDGKYFNSYLLFLPGQTIPWQYDKTHLFRMLDEDLHFTPGDSLPVVDLGWGKVGLAICYDVRFPELIRAYGNRGIDCLLVAAQWGKKRSEHWRTLLRARAIENQIFIVAANAVGPIFENELAGYSAVLDPWGTPVIEADPVNPALLTVGIDLSEINQVRQTVPSKKDQRLELYKHWSDELDL
ncbi:MAG: nitrilase-related carbon-nitrogen hydrolase [Bellilinea sp.]